MMTLQSPRNANTVDSALVTQRLVEGTTTFLQNRLAPWNAFSKQFSADPVKPLATCEARFVSAGGVAGTNLTNFEDATKFVGTNVGIPVTMNQITAGSHSTNAETQSGHALDSWLEATLGTFADALWAIPSALLTEANYGAPTILSAPASFGQAELKTLWAALEKAPVKHLVLDGDFYSQLLPATLDNFDVPKSGIPGWDGVHLNTSWTAAGTLIRGFASGGQGLAVVSGLPLREPEADLVSTVTNITLPIGLTVQMTRWYSNITRSSWRTFDVMLGAAVLDSSALKLVKTT